MKTHTPCIHVRSHFFTILAILFSLPLLPSTTPGQTTQPTSSDTNTIYGGQIVNEQGKPIPDVEVKIFYKPADRMSYTDQTAKTDQAGRWSKRLPLELPDFNIRLIHPEYQSFHFDQLSRTPDLTTLRNQSNVMVMKRGFRIHGIVRDSQGRPIKNVLVCAGEYYSSIDGKIIEDATTARTDDEGKFTIGGLPLRNINLMLSAPRYAPAASTIAIREKMPPLEFAMNPGKTYRGQLLDGKDQPLANVHIHCDKWMLAQGSYNLERPAQTDTRGQFQIDDLPNEGTIEFYFSKKGYMGFSRTVDDLSRTDRLVMYPQQTVTGKVVDDETGAPIRKFEVIPGCFWTSSTKGIFWNVGYARTNNTPDGSFGIQDFGISIEYPYEGTFYIKFLASGYYPEISPGFVLIQPVQPMVYRLKKAIPWQGVVLSSDGKPAKNAQVGWIGPGRTAFVENGAFSKVRYSYQAEFIVNSDDTGKFELPPTLDQGFILALHDTGYAKISKDDFEKSKIITLTPWGRVEGSVRVGTAPAVDSLVHLQDMQAPDDPQKSQFRKNYNTTTDKNGNFVFERVFPGNYQVSRVVTVGEMKSLTNDEQIDVTSNKTVQVKIGGTGRPVTGKIILTEGMDLQMDWTRGTFLIHSVPSDIGFEKMTLEERKKWYRTWLDSKKSTAYDQSHKDSHRYSFTLNPDGTFRAQDILPGQYILSVSIRGPLQSGHCGRGPLLADLYHEFVVPSIPGGRTDEPIDLGTLTLDVKINPQPEICAPDFKVETLEGKTIRLSDFRGKYVLLDFWGTWCPPCRGELPYLKKVYKKFGSDKRFVMISLSLDDSRDELANAIKKNELHWLQGYLGDWDKTKVPRTYGVEAIPAIFLIDPEGIIIESDLRDQAMEIAVKKALKSEK